MCKEKQSESQRSGKRYCIVDHANKQGDRDRPNPNRGLIGKSRTGSRRRERPPARRDDSTAGDGDD